MTKNAKKKLQRKQEALKQKNNKRQGDVYTTANDTIETYSTSQGVVTLRRY